MANLDPSFINRAPEKIKKRFTEFSKRNNIKPTTNYVLAAVGIMVVLVYLITPSLAYTLFTTLYPWYGSIRAM